MNSGLSFHKELRVSARELEERVNTVKSDQTRCRHILTEDTKLRPWDDAITGKLQDLLNETEAGARKRTATSAVPSCHGMI